VGPGRGWWGCILWWHASQRRAWSGTAVSVLQGGESVEGDFRGGTAFYLSDTLGARYLDYLLHRANVPISAFHLEVEIQPEKGEARSTTSIQGGIDGRARRDYERALRKLRAEKSGGAGAGDEVRQIGWTG